MTENIFSLGLQFLGREGSTVNHMMSEYNVIPVFDTLTLIPLTLVVETSPSVRTLILFYQNIKLVLKIYSEYDLSSYMASKWFAKPNFFYVFTILPACKKNRVVLQVDSIQAVIRYNWNYNNIKIPVQEKWIIKSTYI